MAAAGGIILLCTKGPSRGRRRIRGGGDDDEDTSRGMSREMSHEMFGTPYELGEIEYAHSKGMRIPDLPAGARPDANYQSGLEGTIATAEEWIARLRKKDAYQPGRYQASIDKAQALLARSRAGLESYMSIFEPSVVE